MVRQPRVTTLCFGAAAILFCDMVWPQEAPPPVAFSSVTVQGLGNPATASYAKLLRGVDAFVAHQALAPKATLMFRAFDRAPHRAPLVLRLETEARIIPIKHASIAQIIHIIRVSFVVIRFTFSKA